MTTAAETSKPLTRQDFQTDNDVRWCPGCGDYAILAQVQRVEPFEPFANGLRVPRRARAGRAREEPVIGAP